MVSIMYNPIYIYYINRVLFTLKHNLHNILQYSFSLNFNLISEHYTQKSFHQRLPLLLMDSTTTQPSFFLTTNMLAAASPVLSANSSQIQHGSGFSMVPLPGFFCVCTYSFFWMQLSSNNGSNTFLYTDCFGTAWTPLCSVNYSQHTSSWCYRSPSLKCSSGYLLETDHK